MKNEEPLTIPDACLAPATEVGSAGRVNSVRMRLGHLVNSLIYFLRGGDKRKDQNADPAMEVINTIQNTEMRTLVKELHFLTPRTLKTMRDACTKCFILPEECPYVDYSIPDINKAIRRLKKSPSYGDNPAKVLDELAKVNGELAHHLRVNFGLAKEHV